MKEILQNFSDQLWMMNVNGPIEITLNKDDYKQFLTDCYPDIENTSDVKNGEFYIRLHKREIKIKTK